MRAQPVYVDAPPAPQEGLLKGAMVLGPALLLASTAASAAGGGLGKDEIGGALQVYAFAALGVALLGLTRRVGERTPLAGSVLAVMAALGVVAGAGYGIDAIHGAVHAGAPLDELGAGGLALRLPGILFPVSLIGIGVALVRSGIGPRWAALGLALAGLMFPISRIGGVELLAIVADAVLLAALVGLAAVNATLRATGPTATEHSEREVSR